MAGCVYASIGFGLCDSIEEISVWSAYMATMMVCDESGQTIVEPLEPAFLFGRPVTSWERLS